MYNKMYILFNSYCLTILMTFFFNESLGLHSSCSKLSRWKIHAVMSVCRTCSSEDIYRTRRLFSNHLRFKKETIQQLISKNGKAIISTIFFLVEQRKVCHFWRNLKQQHTIYWYVCRVNKYWLQRYNLKTKPKIHTLCMSWGMISQFLDISNKLFFQHWIFVCFIVNIFVS